MYPYLRDLTAVGPNKPLGYLPLNTIINVCATEIEPLKLSLEAKGLKTVIYDEMECHTFSGAFYAYDETALQNLLEMNDDVLTEHKWPKNPALFVEAVAKFTAKRKTKLFDLIADAFNDHDNTGRTDV